MPSLKEFVGFLKEYNVIALSIAVIIGTASKDLVNSFVDNILMPIISPIIPGGAWEKAIIYIGSIEIRMGLFLAETIEFTIIALVVFLIAKKILKEEKVSKK